MHVVVTKASNKMNPKLLGITAVPRNKENVFQTPGQ